MISGGANAVESCPSRRLIHARDREVVIISVVTLVIMESGCESVTIWRYNACPGWRMFWIAGSNGDGSSDVQSDSTKHANPGGDSGQRDQSRPEAAVRRQVYGADRERAGMRVSEFGGAAARDSHHAERTAGRRKRDGTGGELFATGQRRQVFSDWGFALHARKCLGDRRSSGRLGCRGAGRSYAKPREPRSGQRSEADREQESVALQSVFRKRQSSSQAQIEAATGFQGVI